MSDEDELEYLPCNGAEGQPCPHGCIMARIKKTGKLVMAGDCRNPYTPNCKLNEIVKNPCENHW